MSEGTRAQIKARFNLLDPEFLTAIAEVLGYGAENYGDKNWQKGLPGDKSGLNHAIKHIADYMSGKQSDLGDVRTNLAQACVNLM